MFNKVWIHLLIYFTSGIMSHVKKFIPSDKVNVGTDNIRYLDDDI